MTPAYTPRRPAPASRQSAERVPVLIFDEPSELARQAARQVRTLIEARSAAGDPAVLGLPTGSTPIGVYQELIRMHREEGLDFSNVVTFNIDEYVPMQPDSLQSYHRFMRENFFDHVNIPEGNVHIPRGDLPPEAMEQHAAEYERAIQRAGGLDLLLLGIGRSGHIGFNEPGSTPEDRTRLIVLDEITRKDAASDFFEEKYVPREAITMGVGTILDAREIILMATGEHKAPIVRQAVEEAPNAQVSATYLQMHQNATFYVDRAAASELTREKTPWLVRRVDWDDAAAKRAVIWLSRQTEKAILRLDEGDFHRNHLHDLVHARGGVDELCRMVFEDLRRRVVYTKGLPRKKKVLVFSPHPDDDVISMGGMLHALVQNKNEVTVAYMTNGSVAVFDQDVRRHLRFVDMTSGVMGSDSGAIADKVKGIMADLEAKAPAEVDTAAVQEIKATIRYTEAITALEVMGLGAENARFMDMPFYRTGRVKKDPISEADVEIVLDLFRELEPTHIYVAGDLSDPHGTHRMCYVAIEQALIQYNAEIAPEASGPGAAGETAPRKGDLRPLVWLYRGAWQEWEIDRADVFLPMSRADLDLKIEAIYKHESQKDRALFPGAYDEREFWERARDRNTSTAAELDALGLPECYAVEAFVTVHEMP
ncbi:glucosamine-6-phosphate deaminase [Rubricoccus marinus]|uniref:Glucosamine-6-phosphate deaminase n=1 Tax=Rubricoccus marinus TaxID=716817 RepID=A0A259U0K6_9BACT|nr:glucosamine-6-phosphate deaminase [Rubricoccus marinus]OZC03511.1 glucosamine-6-phosphate deaminase [Rubricoccus marinus]